MSCARDEAAAVAIAGELYVLGGFDGVHVLREVERFSPLSTAWESLPPMSTARTALAATAINGQLYACGGSDGLQCLCSLERFDPVAGAWEALPSMSQARKTAAALEVNGRLLVLGGTGREKESEDGQMALSSAECFDPEVGAWQVLPEMPRGRELVAMIGLP